MTTTTSLTTAATKAPAKRSNIFCTTITSTVPFIARNHVRFRSPSQPNSLNHGNITAASVVPSLSPPYPDVQDVKALAPMEFEVEAVAVIPNTMSCRPCVLVHKGLSAELYHSGQCTCETQSQLNCALCTVIPKPYTPLKP